MGSDPYFVLVAIFSWDPDIGDFSEWMDSCPVVRWVGKVRRAIVDFKLDDPIVVVNCRQCASSMSVLYDVRELRRHAGDLTQYATIDLDSRFKNTDSRKYTVKLNHSFFHSTGATNSPI